MTKGLVVNTQADSIEADMTRVLFILKQRQTGPVGSWNHSPDGKALSSGLFISASQMQIALDEIGLETKLVHVVDNNAIDREVHWYKPTHVIIEAFWVVPDKFDILKKLHPTVKWIIRNHSKTDFLAHEGAKVGWAMDTLKKGLVLGCNSPEATSDFKNLCVSIGADPALSVYLPNYYSAPAPAISREDVQVWLQAWKDHQKGAITAAVPMPAIPKIPGEFHVGCFGAVRPLKNHLHQALASIEAADRLRLNLRFYINSTRVEGNANALLDSIRALFLRFTNHQLVEMPWMDHTAFTAEMRKMDVLMQVSNSETFNIVAADAVSMGVPAVVSDEIPWMGSDYHANPNNVGDQVAKLLHVWRMSGSGHLQADQLWQLRDYAAQSKQLWCDHLGVNLQPV
jgi:hypothetical protein